MSAAVNPFEGWKFWANAAFNHSRFVNFDVWTGNTPPDVAPVIVNAGASYRFNHGAGRSSSAARCVMSVRVLSTDQHLTLDQYTTEDVYAFVDIPGRDVAWPEIKTFRITFRVRNLTNVVYAPCSDTSYPDQVLLVRRGPMKLPLRPNGEHRLMRALILVHRWRRMSSRPR